MPPGPDPRRHTVTGRPQVSAGTSPSRESTCSWFEKHRPDPPKQSTPVPLAAPGLKALPATDGAYASLSPRVREGGPPGSCPGPTETPSVSQRGPPCSQPGGERAGSPSALLARRRLPTRGRDGSTSGRCQTLAQRSRGEETTPDPQIQALPWGRTRPVSASRTGPEPETDSHAELSPQLSTRAAELRAGMLSPHTCSTSDPLKELSFSLETELLRKSKCLVFKLSLCFKKAGARQCRHQRWPWGNGATPVPLRPAEGTPGGTQGGPTSADLTACVAHGRAGASTEGKATPKVSGALDLRKETDKQTQNVGVMRAGRRPGQSGRGGVAGPGMAGCGGEGRSPGDLGGEGPVAV